MKPITVDIINNRVVMTRAFAAKAADPYSYEYVKLQDIIERFPNLKVENHTIRRNPNKEGYRGLTYDYMRDYIKTHVEEEIVEYALAELEDQIYLSKCHSTRYPKIKKWFLEKYKDVKKFGVQGEWFGETDENKEEVHLDLKLVG